MEVLTVKTCTKCKVVKPQDSEHFPLHNKTKSGFDSWCRVCRSSYRSETRRGNYRTMISDEDLKDIITTVKECVICGDFGELVVDHCHTTNKVRGMLCGSCNLGLGKFKDDPQLLEFARIYLLANSDKEEDVEEYSDYIKTYE
jgi:hypothetical protein